MLNRRFRGRAMFRLLFFLPYVLSEAITGIVFSLMLRPDALVDTALSRAGLSIGDIDASGLQRSSRVG